MTSRTMGGFPPNIPQIPRSNPPVDQVIAPVILTMPCRAFLADKMLNNFGSKCIWFVLLFEMCFAFR